MRIIIIVVFFITFISSIAMAKTQRIAVLDLETINTSKVYAKIVRNILEVGLYKTKKYQIVERKQIKLILKEQGLQMSGCVDSACAVKIGKILSADYMVIGSLHKIKTYTITIKLVDVAKGTIVYADSNRAKNDEKLEDSVHFLINKLQNSKYSKKLKNTTGSTNSGNGNTTSAFVGSLFFTGGSNKYEANYNEYSGSATRDNYSLGLFFQQKSNNTNRFSASFLLGVESTGFRIKGIKSTKHHELDLYLEDPRSYYIYPIVGLLGIDVSSPFSIFGHTMNLHAIPFAGVGCIIQTENGKPNVNLNLQKDKLFLTTGIALGIDVLEQVMIFTKLAAGEVYQVNNHFVSIIVYHVNLGLLFRI